MPNLAKQKRRDEKFLKHNQNSNLSDLMWIEEQLPLQQNNLQAHRPSISNHHRSSIHGASLHRASIHRESMHRPSLAQSSMSSIPRSPSLSYEKLIKDLAKEIKECQDTEKSMNNSSEPGQTKMRTRLNKAWMSFLTSAWCYGLGKIFAANRHVFKIMWTFFITISTMFCAIYIHRQISNYLMYYVITETHIVYETSMIFPQVTLCKDNKVLHNEFVVERCEFDRIDCRDKFDLVSVFDDFGKKRECLRFNGGTNFTGHAIERVYQTRETSIFNGLKLIVSHRSGELNLVYIADYERNSYYSADQLIKMKESVSIGLDKFHAYKIGEPYNRCVKRLTALDGELVKKTLKFNTVYQREKCNYLCFFKLTAKKYNCSFPGLYELEYNRTDCTTQLSKRVLGAEMNLFNASIDCIEECPFQCDKSHYELKVNHDYDNFELQNNTFKMFIYYKDLKYSKVTQIPKTQFPDLVAQIGGTLGLFIGFRLLSFIDILQFFLEAFIIVCERVKTKTMGTQV